MVFVIARLGKTVGVDRRMIFVRGEEKDFEVGEQVRGLPDGAVVLLHGAKPPWIEASQPALQRWPEDLGSFENILANRRGDESVDLQDCLTVHGAVTVDPRGVPLELGKARQNRIVLNYTGWRLGDFPRGKIKVIVSTAPSGQVLIVPPASVRAPRDDLVLEEGPRRPTMPRPRQTKPPEPIRFERSLKFMDLQFVDGAVLFWVQDRKVTVSHEKALFVYQAVRKELDAEQPEGVSVKGELLAGGASEVAITGLEGLDRLFVRVLRGQFIRRSLASADWLEAEELARSLPGGPGTEDLEALLDIEELGLRRREEAFRRLFAHRDRSARVLTLPGRAVVIPIAGCDRGPRFYAWETVTSDYATYFFRPTDAAAVRRMLDWTRDPAHRRRELLGDRDLQTELCFVARVVHHGDAGDFAEWWAEVCRVTGIRE